MGLLTHVSSADRPTLLPPTQYTPSDIVGLSYTRIEGEMGMWTPQNVLKHWRKKTTRLGIVWRTVCAITVVTVCTLYFLRLVHFPIINSRNFKKVIGLGLGLFLVLVSTDSVVQICVLCSLHVQILSILFFMCPTRLNFSLCCHSYMYARHCTPPVHCCSILTSWLTSHGRSFGTH